MWGPIIYGPGPLAHGESTGPSRRRPWPKLKIRSTKWPGDIAEDSLVLGRPKVSLMKVVYEQTLKIRKYLREVVLNTLH